MGNFKGVKFDLTLNLLGGLTNWEIPRGSHSLEVTFQNLFILYLSTSNCHYWLRSLTLIVFFSNLSQLQFALIYYSLKINVQLGKDIGKVQATIQILDFLWVDVHVCFALLLYFVFEEVWICSNLLLFALLPTKVCD